MNRRGYDKIVFTLRVQQLAAFRAERLCLSISFLIIGGYASAEGAASPSMIDEKAKPFHTEGGKAASFED